jgi:hypothetical protein
MAVNPDSCCCGCCGCSCWLLGPFLLPCIHSNHKVFCFIAVEGQVQASVLLLLLLEGWHAGALLLAPPQVTPTNTTTTTNNNLS